MGFSSFCLDLGILFRVLFKAVYTDKVSIEHNFIELGSSQLYHAIVYRAGSSREATTQDAEQSATERSNSVT